jgi:hypothetical protein
MGSGNLFVVQVQRAVNGDYVVHGQCGQCKTFPAGSEDEIGAQVADYLREHTDQKEK